MFDPLKDIKDFHVKFDLAYDGPPRSLPPKMAVLRRRLLREELEEYCTADNLEEQLDALVDLMYVLLGTAYLHGFNRFGEAWSRIQAANMLKVRATVPEDSPRGSTLDVVKPPGWSPASLTDLVSAD